MKYPRAIQVLIELLSKLPSVGPKTAARYVFYLLKQEPDYLQALALSIAELKEKSVVCRSCQAIAESNPCSICSDPKRNNGQLMVVADTRDMLAIEGTRQFNGLYHILGGVINPLENISPDQLNINSLYKKLNDFKIKEIILGLNPDFEGETTALYLIKNFKSTEIKITRLARGLPQGADLEYADEITLGNALKYRNEL